MFFYITGGGGGGGGGGTVISGGQSIPNGASSVAVVFATAFSSAPTVRVTMGVPDGMDSIYATVQKSTVTVNGFTANLSASTDSADYILYWEASVSA